MQKMTTMELDARINQFMQRKRENFPELFNRFDTLPSGGKGAHGSLPGVR
jgi:hypothetical protein